MIHRENSTMRNLSATALATLLLASIFSSASAADGRGLFSNLRVLPLTGHEAHDAAQRAEADAKRNADPKLKKFAAKLAEDRAAARRTVVLSDRDVYWNDDGQGQFVVLLNEYDMAQPDLTAQIILVTGKGEAIVAKLKLDAANPSNKLTFLLNTDALPVGTYALTARISGTDGTQIGRGEPLGFKRVDKTHPIVPIPPEGIPVAVHPQDIVPDASWPITTGIPMPFGTVRDPAELQLLENGKSVPCQWTVRSTWTPGTPTFIRWLTLDFVAKYDGTRPREYRIVKAVTKNPAAGIRVEQMDGLITVENGPVRFQIKRRGFNGIDAAWLDANGDGKLSENEQQVDAQTDATGGGPFLTDEKGVVYRAADDPTAEVSVEEQGPVRVTILARGWYVNATLPEKERKLCQFVTRITAYAGQPTIFFNHRTVLTYDTTQKKLADVGFRVGTSGAKGWLTGLDGTASEGELPAKQSVWIHQERADRVRLVEGESDVTKREGKHADGWMATTSKSGTTAVLLKDIWQKFPKELEADRSGLVLHFWPRHGRETFSEQEQVDRPNVHKCWFAENGKLLDMQMPKYLYDALSEGKPQPSWDPENTLNKGFASNGTGTAIGNEFAIHLAAPSMKGDALARQERLFQLNPHALAAPEWNVRTGVEAPMAARNDRRLPEIERVINEDFPASMFGMIDFLGEYGMWIYANTHNTWRGPLPELHRIWQNSHYQHVGGAWVLYFRGNTPELLRWARAQSDNYMDVGTVNYADPERPMKGHVAGGMHHAKAFVPWGAAPAGMPNNDSDGGVWGHFIDPDAFLYRYYIEGNLRAWDLYRMWGHSLHGGKLPLSGNGRETINTFGMMLNYYRATWDPQAILSLRTAADGIHAKPLETSQAAPSFPVWYKTWAERYYDLARDERPIAALKSYVAAGHGHIAPNCFLYRVTGDKGYLDKILGAVRRDVLLTYRNADDVLNGFSDYSSGRGQETLMQLPGFLEAAEKAGITSIEPGANDVSTFPGGTVYALDPDDREFKVRLTGQSQYQPTIKILAPSGKLMKTVILGGKAKDGSRNPDSETVVIPPDGEKGLYAIQITGYFNGLLAPLTDLPHEVVALTPDKPIRTGGLQHGYFAVPPKSEATLQFTAVPYGPKKETAMPVPALVRIRDTAGQPVLDTTLLDIGKRDHASVELKSGDKIGVWPCIMFSRWGPSVTWSGTASGVYFSLKPEAFEPVLRALAEKFSKN
jgi:hypothetical protein